MEGRIQKAREGKWNGGFTPYGYQLVDGKLQINEEEAIWQAAQVKLLAQAKKYEHVNKAKDTKTHLLSGIVKCPVCGGGDHCKVSWQS